MSTCTSDPSGTAKPSLTYCLSCKDVPMQVATWTVSGTAEARHNYGTLRRARQSRAYGEPPDPRDTSKVEHHSRLPTQIFPRHNIAFCRQFFTSVL
ncbi:hypothetical protein E2C01_017692 [Portunus trituberculatus]|uniref:Uncharacterized protein n=1 Tax=Portunus trituberculatus TaxID=210409 RepID=A0A5B7DUF6_PORTR|nr:hypothetical protein [Portunus trituberculatus]